MRLDIMARHYSSSILSLYFIVLASVVSANAQRRPRRGRIVGGGIAGIIVGAIILALLVLICLCFCMRRRKQQARTSGVVLPGPGGAGTGGGPPDMRPAGGGAFGGPQPQYEPERQDYYHGGPGDANTNKQGGYGVPSGSMPPPPAYGAQGNGQASAYGPPPGPPPPAHTAPEGAKDNFVGGFRT